jgi:P27 family predicted phage terminase small subunit
MAKGRGKNAPDRADEITAQGVTAEEVVFDAPSVLPPRAQEMWDYITKTDSALRILCPEDTPLLEQYCMSYQIYHDARESYMALPACERTREDTLTGTKRNSDIDVMMRCSDQMVKIAKQLGLSPITRAQLKLTAAATSSLMSATFPERIRQMYEASNARQG